MAQLSFTTDWPQGPLPKGFDINLEGGYVALVGANNAAKSSILQAIFRQHWNRRNELNKDDTCLILPERLYVDINTQVGGRTLENYNNELANTIGINNTGNKSYAAPTGPACGELPKLLLDHWDFEEQLRLLRTYLLYFGLPVHKLSGGQQITFEDVSIAVQGSGLRSIFAILAALTDKHIKLLLIDEPEQSLEAGVQKQLRDLFYQVSEEQGTQIIVTTHSHLFLNRRTPMSNYAVSKPDGRVNIRMVASQEELYDITFGMLGSSVEDLFLPYNYMIVEGHSDAIIVSKVMELKHISIQRVKVLDAEGVGNVPNLLYAVRNALRPLVASDSPYASRVVALVDQPATNAERTHHRHMQRDIGDRLVTLDQPTLEAYLPATLYTKCGRNKKADLARIDRLKRTHSPVGALKVEIANAISGVLALDDLAGISFIVEAVDRAIR